MPNRRTFLQGLLSSGTLLATTEASPIADTASGRVQGGSIRGVHIFRGIPYAGPATRFLPPTQPPNWTGIRDAKQTGPRCVQGPGNIFLSPLIGEYFAGGRPDRTELAKQTDSEDCLNLNVLTPGLKGNRPVMVYMHGGGLTGGSSALTLFSDGHVREQDVVLVGVNHRLNVFGYTYLGGLSPQYATGNVGQLDLIAALHWIKANIANFGGDPNNVTIFGESGGGAKISALLAMPAAKGLFHKAAVQSGSVLRAGDPETATAAAKKLLANLGLDLVDGLRTVPTAKLFAASRNIGPTAVIVDGHSLPHQTWDPKAPELSAAIPLLIGCNKDETSLSYTKDAAVHSLTEAGLKDRIIAAGIPHGSADKLLNLYRRDHPRDSPTDLWFRITTDRGTRRNSLLQAERKAEQNKAKVFFYYCQWETPLAEGNHKIKAFHTSDLPLTMRLVRFPESEQLSRQLSAAWAAFARTGNPSAKALPWPAFTLKDRATMIFDGGHSSAVNDPDGDQRRLLETFSSTG